MTARTTGFLGGGRITAIFLEALGGRGIALERVTVSDTNAETLAKLRSRFPRITTTAVNADAAAAEARAEMEALLDALGAHPVVPEEQLEAYAILSGMGPTCFWFQWQTLRELSGSFGLGPAEADVALRAMLDGAVRAFFDSGLTAGQVADLVPVKPLAEAAPQISQAYRDSLPKLYAKLKGA
jgi:pyrroline-5-carboxylate reductase